MNQESLNSALETPAAKAEKKPKKWLKPLIFTLVSIILIAAAGVVGYLWRDSSAVKQANEDTQEISDLQKKIQSLEADIKKIGSSGGDDSSKPKTDVRALAVDAVTTKNYEPLQPYLADTVNVILAASEGVGPRTPDQAVVDMEYLNAGTAPWDFELDGTILSDYRSGDYAAYFPVSALVGKAANGYVVSFSFNADGEISTIFMSVSDDIL